MSAMPDERLAGRRDIDAADLPALVAEYRLHPDLRTVVRRRASEEQET